MGRDLGACQIIELLDITISFKTNPIWCDSYWTLVLNIPEASFSPSFSNARLRRAHHYRYAAYLCGNSNVSDIGLGNILLSLPTIDICIEYGEFSINTGPRMWNTPSV